MDELMTRYGATASLLLAFAVGALVTALLAAMAMRQQRAGQRQGEGRIRKSLRVTLAQLDQARKEAEVLQVEVQGWRQRSAHWQGERRAALQPKRAVELSAPASVPDAWVLGSDMQEPQRKRRVSPERDFADTQIEPVYLQ
jgi:uncharacterized protein YlxW (UPF0749 family)